MAAKISARKAHGDDSHSWAVFIKFPDRELEFVNGLTKSEVPYYKAMADKYAEECIERDELREKVRNLLDPLDELALECDGFARVAHAVLNEAGIKHTVYVGSVDYADYHVPLHYWIMLGDGATHHTIVDYRLRMWTDANAPHGVLRFKETERAGVFYNPEREANVDTPPAVLAVLMSHRK